MKTFKKLTFACELCDKFDKSFVRVDKTILILSDMLQLSPAETIIFQKNTSNELVGNVHILNVSKKAVTYKVVVLSDAFVRKATA